jgi:hypothetical protein
VKSTCVGSYCCFVDGDLERERERENENFFEFVLDLERCDCGSRDEPDS